MGEVPVEAQEREALLNEMIAAFQDSDQPLDARVATINAVAVNIFYAEIVNDFKSVPFDRIVVALRVAEYHIAKNSEVTADLNQHKELRAFVLNCVHEGMWKNIELLGEQWISLLNEFSTEKIVGVLNSERNERSLLSFIKDWKGSDNKTLLHHARTPEMAEYLLKHGLAIDALILNRNRTALGLACRGGNFEMAECLLKNGASTVYLLYKEDEPFERIEWNKLNHEQAKKWKMLFLLYELHVTPEQFVALPMPLQNKILEEFKALRFIRFTSLNTLFALDTTREKQRIVEFIDSVSNDSSEDKFKNTYNKTKRMFLMAHACEISLYQKRHHTVFFGLPRDVAKIIVKMANPDVVFKVATTVDKIPKKPNEELREELIERLGGYTTRYEKDLAEGADISETNYEALCVMRTALLEPTRENIEQVQASRESYYEVCEDERFSVLFKNCLAKLDEDKKQLRVVARTGSPRL